MAQLIGNLCFFEDLGEIHHGNISIKSKKTAQTCLCALVVRLRTFAKLASIK